MIELEPFFLDWTGHTTSQVCIKILEHDCAFHCYCSNLVSILSHRSEFSTQLGLLSAQHGTTPVSNIGFERAAAPSGSRHHSHSHWDEWQCVAHVLFDLPFNAT